MFRGTRDGDEDAHVLRSRCKVEMLICSMQRPQIGTFVQVWVQRDEKRIKGRCISIVGVQLRNNVKMDNRMVNSFLVFKGIIYKTILESYKCD